MTERCSEFENHQLFTALEIHESWIEAVLCCADLLAPSVIWRSQRRSLLAPCQADLVFSTLAFDEDHCYF